MTTNPIFRLEKIITEIASIRQLIEACSIVTSSTRFILTSRELSLYEARCEFQKIRKERPIFLTQKYLNKRKQALEYVQEMEKKYEMEKKDFKACFQDDKRSNLNYLRKEKELILEKANKNWLKTYKEELKIVSEDTIKEIKKAIINNDK